MATLFFARHGENQANVLRQLSHRVVDYPLTERGREQAQRLAERFVLDGTQAAVVVASPLKRAAETASIIASALGCSVNHDDRLREIDVGALDGRRDDDAWELYYDTLRAWREGDARRAFPDGENLVQLADRIGKALAAAAAVPSPAAVDSAPHIAIVIGHGAGMRAALGLMANAPDPRRDLALGDVAVFDWAPGAAVGRLVSWGAASLPATS